MSFARVPRVAFARRVSEDVGGATGKGGLKLLRDIVAGRDATFPRSRAMDLLQATDFPNKHRDLQAVLENEEEAAEIRYLAAIHLGKMAIPAALDILVRNRHVRNERVLTGVMRALGRIGNASTLEAIETARTHATGAAATQAAFAARLIAHRAGVEEPEARAAEATDPPEHDLQCARPFRILRADNEDAERCLRSLGAQPFGIEFSEHPMYRVVCGRNNWMILFNREYSHAGTVETLRKRKGFVGVVALRSEATRLYSVAYLILSSPISDEDEKVSIQIYRPNGKLTLRGTAEVVEDWVRFSIRAVSQPGAIAVKIEGTFADGRLNLTTALATTSIQTKKRVPPEDPAGQIAS